MSKGGGSGTDSGDPYERIKRQRREIASMQFSLISGLNKADFSITNVNQERKPSYLTIF
jgi:hypothetical protein